MKLLVVTALLAMLLTGCGLGKNLGVNEKGLCDGLAPKIDSLNDALLIDGGQQTILAGEDVITGYDAGCYGTVVR
jgi:hypothetical protein